MFNHILIPLDGSLLAEQALDVVQHVLRPAGKITLMMALPVPSLSEQPTVEGSELAATDEAPQPMTYLEHIAQRLKLKGFEVQIEMRDGDPAELIIDLALHLGVDIIVMGSHARSGLERILFGSLSAKVLESTPCPVLFVPDRVRQPVQTPIPIDPDTPDLTPGLVN